MDVLYKIPEKSDTEKWQKILSQTIFQHYGKIQENIKKTRQDSLRKLEILCVCFVQIKV
jgi:hypothetical protein